MQVVVVNQPTIGRSGCNGSRRRHALLPDAHDDRPTSLQSIVLLYLYGRPRLLNVAATMRSLLTFSTALLLGAAGLAASAEDLVTKARIKVQLFAATSFVSEVSIDANNNFCVSLDNNL